MTRRNWTLDSKTKRSIRFRFSLVNIHSCYLKAFHYGTVLLTFSGLDFFAGKEYDRFFPIAYGEDIKSADADENEARWSIFQWILEYQSNLSQCLSRIVFNRSCETGSLNATLVKGKVLLCFESRYQRSAVAAARTVQEGQGVGLIFARFLTKEVTMCLDVPCVHVDFTTGTSLLTYIASTRWLLTCCCLCH